MATSLQKVPALVASHSVFNANGSLFAKIVGPFYAVYSYGEHFPVAIRQRTNDDPWLVNTNSTPTKMLWRSAKAYSNALVCLLQWRHYETPRRTRWHPRLLACA